MKSIKSFIKKPRNIYFSIIGMLTIVTGLVSISFSYIDESSMEGTLKYASVDNRIQSSDLIDNKVSLAPHETKEILVYVMSNNDFNSNFKLVYNTNQNVIVYSEEVIDEVVEAREVQNYKLIISNYEDEPAEITLEIASSRDMQDLIYEGKVVQVLE